MEMGSSGKDMATWACVKLTDTTIDPVKVIPTENIHNYSGQEIDYNKKYNVRWQRKWRPCQICFIEDTFEAAQEKKDAQRVLVRPMNARLLSASDITETENSTDPQSENDGGTQSEADNIQENLEEISNKRKMALIAKHSKPKYDGALETEGEVNEQSPHQEIMEIEENFEKQEGNESNDGTSLHSNATAEKTVFEDGQKAESTRNESGTKAVQKVKLPEMKRKIELRHQDSCKGQCAVEMKKMRKEFEKTERINSNFRTDVMNLLKSMQGNWEQLKATEPQNPNNILENFGLNPKPGFIKHDENGIKIIHLGSGIWLNENEYNQVVWSSSSNAIFVKNLAMKVFGEDTLKSHSVSGMVAPKTGEQRAPLDATNCLAIKDAYEMYLKKSARWTNEDEILEELDNVGHYLQEKIVDLNRKPRPKTNKTTTKSSKTMTKRRNSGNVKKNRQKLKKSGCRGRKEKESGMSSSSDDDELAKNPSILEMNESTSL